MSFVLVNKQAVTYAPVGVNVIQVAFVLTFSVTLAELMHSAERLNLSYITIITFIQANTLEYVFTYNLARKASYIDVGLLAYFVPYPVRGLAVGMDETVAEDGG